MIRKIIPFLAAVVLLAVSPAFAGDYYAGASIGQASSDIAVSDIDDGSLTGSADDSDTCWKIYGGYKFMKFFAVEAAVMDLGEVSIDATSDGLGLLYTAGNVNATSSVDGYSIAALGTLPVGSNVQVFGKIGYLFWDAENTIANAALPGGSLSGDTDGEDIVMGAGVVWDYTGPGSLRVEYEQGELENTDMYSISTGLSFRF